MWIQTDVSTSTINAGAYAGFGNNQMLCADPTTRRTRRFLVGPNAVRDHRRASSRRTRRRCSSASSTPARPPSGDSQPGEPEQYSSWPDGPGSGRPRSSLLVITKDDGGQIGS